MGLKLRLRLSARKIEMFGKMMTRRGRRIQASVKLVTKRAKLSETVCSGSG